MGFQWFFQIQNGSFTNRTQNLTLSPGAQSIFCYLWWFCSFLPFLFDDKPMAWEINSSFNLNSMPMTYALTPSNDSANALETGHRSHSNDYTNFEGFRKPDWNIQSIYPHSCISIYILEFPILSKHCEFLCKVIILWVDT